MPRDSSGNYTLPLGNPVVDGTIIDTEWANPTMADIAVQLNNVLTRDGLLGPILPMFFVDGTEALPGIAFAANHATGIYRPGGGGLGFSVGGAKYAEMSGGISTFEALTVAGEFIANGSSTLGNAAADTLVINGTVIGIPNGVNFTNGKIGVGRTATAESFEVDRALAVFGALQTAAGQKFALDFNGTTGRILSFGNTVGTPGIIDFYQGSSDNSVNRVALHIASTGNISARGLDTSVAGFTLGSGTVTGENFFRLFTTTNDLYLGQSAGTIMTWPAGAIGVLLQNAANPLGLATLTNQPILLGTNGLERVRVENNGNVVVNSATSPGQFLSVFGNSQTTGIPGSFNDTRADAASSACVVFTRSGAQVGSITTTNAATAYNTSSDARLKENIVDAEQALNVLADIQVRQFDWKAGGHQAYGFIAQELYDLVPDAVSPGGADVSTSPWGLDNSKLVPLLVKALQEVLTRVELIEQSI